MACSCAGLHAHPACPRLLAGRAAEHIFCRMCRVWEAAYEQLQMEKGACNLLQKYSPEAVRERALSTPSASMEIVVCPAAYLDM